MALTQTAFRFRNDDGNEATATWKAAQNTNITLPSDERFRVRFLVVSSVSPPVQNDNFRLHYSHNGGTYTPIGFNSDTTTVDARATTNFAGDAPTTEQMGGSGNFNPGSIDETNGTAPAFANTPALNDETECEYCIIVQGAATAPGDTIDLRIYDGLVPIDAYTQTARLTLDSTPPAAPTGLTATMIGA